MSSVRAQTVEAKLATLYDVPPVVTSRVPEVHWFFFGAMRFLSVGNKPRNLFPAAKTTKTPLGNVTAEWTHEALLPKFLQEHPYPAYLTPNSIVKNLP